MSGFRVMVVTEHPVMREVLASLVQERGLEVYPAADGIDALRQIYNVQPRVIISDAALPNLAGFELLPFVRRRFPEIGVIALTDARRTDDALDVIADVFISVEPFNPQLLGDTLAGLVSKYPFRVHKEADSQARTARGASTCPTCERLQQQTSIARLNAMLATVWLRLHPGDSEAAHQDRHAEMELSRAMMELKQHQNDAHPVRETVPAGRNLPARPQSIPRRANG